MEGVEDVHMCTRQGIEAWRRKVEDLESKKRELVKEMHGALKEKDDQLKEKDEEMAKLREQNAPLIQHIDNLKKRLGEVGCTGKKLGDLGSRQRYWKFKELKGRAEVVYEIIWVGINLPQGCGYKTWELVHS